LERTLRAGLHRGVLANEIVNARIFSPQKSRSDSRTKANK